MKVELTNICKYFGRLCANDEVCVTAEPGTIHGLLGENGAGKSTLMKVLTGFITADSGDILLDGQPVTIQSPNDAVERGIGMLYQDPLDFAALTVLDNFVLGNRGGVLPDRGRARRELSELAKQFDFTLDPDALISSLSVGERQQLEITRLLGLGVRVLILDEPTTAISAQQKAKLFAALRKLAAQGKTVIFVSHKLEEVAELCTRVTVLARGRVTGEADSPFSPDQLVRMMFGQIVTLRRRQPVPFGEPVLRLEEVGVSDWRLEMKDLNVTVRAGEVLGLAGLEGSGQRLLLQVAAGLKRPTRGRVLVNGKNMAGCSYIDYLDAGVSFVPAGRLEEGLIAGMTITEHVALSERSKAFVVNWPETERKAAERIRQYNIKGNPRSQLQELSGGNQQRTLLGLLPSKLNLLLMEHPTRGLDLESAEYIWGLLLERTKAGTAVVFASADLDELLDRSDRIIVFFSGRAAATVDARTTAPEQLGELIGGKGL